MLVLVSGVVAGGALASGPVSALEERGEPVLHAQEMDTATSGCLRNPACYTHSPGEESIIPWLSRAGEMVQTTTVVMRLLDATDLSSIEEIVVQCARRADDEVNNEDAVLQGRSPERDECRKVVRQERGRDVTRAMDLGDKKHALALACIRGRVARLFPENVSVEPRYQLDPTVGKWVRLAPSQVAEWLRTGLTSQLRGSLAPDLVIHESGNPNQVQRVYDLKFPCPETNRPAWGTYTQDQPHFPKNQGQMYGETLLEGKSAPRLVTPGGIQ